MPSLVTSGTPPCSFIQIFVAKNSGNSKISVLKPWFRFCGNLSVPSHFHQSKPFPRSYCTARARFVHQNSVELPISWSNINNAETSVNYNFCRESMCFSCGKKQHSGFGWYFLPVDMRKDLKIDEVEDFDYHNGIGHPFFCAYRYWAFTKSWIMLP